MIYVLLISSVRSRKLAFHGHAVLIKNFMKNVKQYIKRILVISSSSMLMI